MAMDLLLLLELDNKATILGHDILKVYNTWNDLSKQEKKTFVKIF
jgi:hypothetical protein